MRDLDKQELIPPFITPQWRRGPHTYIDNDADKARERHDRECAANKSLSIYTDGSGIEGEIGSAAVCPLTQQTRSVHMGPDTQSTVYAAELQGISLALQIAQGYASGDGERKDIAIYTDNQAAIWSIAKAEGRLRAYYARICTAGESESIYMTFCVSLVCAYILRWHVHKRVWWTCSTL